MVNEKKTTSTRAQILDILRNSRKPVSGEWIAENLGISRVAVWKTVKGLNEGGYRILASALGYALEQDDKDSLNPWEFGPNESLIRHWSETDSTMNRAREAALASCPAGTVVVADAQTQGRGTGDKTWNSVPGGLFYTLITRPNLNSAFAHRQVLAAQCALVRAIQSVSGRSVYPGWPNDILSDTEKGARKAGGILSELLVSGNRTEFLNLGIGINTGSAPDLSETAEIMTGRKALLSAFLREFGNADHERETLSAEWNSLCPDIGKTVYFRFNEEKTGVTAQFPTRDGAGIFRGVDTAGYAILESLETDNLTPSNSITRYPPGSISLRSKGRKA